MKRGSITATVLTALAALAALPDLSEAQGNVRLDIANPAVTFPQPGLAHFDTGWIEHPGVVVSVTSTPQNRAWELLVRAESPTLGGIGKPVSEMEWRRDGSAVWTPLSTADVAVLQSSGNQDVTIYFRTLLAWGNDVPATYTADLTFTLVR